MARITNLKAQLIFGGARPTDFEVQFINPVDPSGDLKAAFLCKAAQIPQSQLGEIPMMYHGQPVFFAGNRTFEPWTVTIINDEDFLIRTALERWSDAISGHESNIMSLGSASPLLYQSQAIVTQYSKTGAPLEVYKFKNIWPQLIGPIDLSWDTVDQIEQYDVTFRYDSWEKEGTTT